MKVTFEEMELKIEQLEQAVAKIHAESVGLVGLVTTTKNIVERLNQDKLPILEKKKKE